MYFQNQSSIAEFAPSTTYCVPNATTLPTCFPQSQNPTVLHLANGDVGVGFSEVTTANSSSCYGAANQSVSRIEFASSSTDGASFGTPVFVGGNGSSECPYFQDVEPSFAVDQNGEVFAAYIGGNATRAQMTQPIANLVACPSGLCAPILGYFDRPSAALILAHSSNNGASFSPGAIIQAGGNSVYPARPQIATIGSTIYVVYENTHNSSTPLGGQPFYPSSVLLTVSTNYGATWSTPTILPGLNDSGATNFQQHYTALSPSISVDPANGELAVAYATNRSCIEFCQFKAPGTQWWGEEIVVATSTDNGTTWSPLRDVGPAGEAQYAGYGTVGGANTTWLFEYGPVTSIAWNPSTAALYVAWSGAYNLSGYDVSNDFGRSSVFAAASANGGATWSSTPVVPRMVESPSTFYEGYYDPSIAEYGGTVYLTYSYYNSSVPCGCGSPLLSGEYSQWVVESSDGVHWGSPILAAFFPETDGLGLSSYQGYTSSIAFDSDGNVVVAGALATAYEQVTGGTQYVNAANVTVATIAQSSTASVTVTIPGLPAGTDWTVGFNGNVYSTSSSSLTVSGIPTGVPILVDPEVPREAVGFEEYNGTRGSLFEVFQGTTSLSFPDIEWAGVSVSVVPGNLPFVSLSLSGPNVTYSSISQAEVESGVLSNSTYGCAFPWYLPVGARVTFSDNASRASAYSGVYEAATGAYAAYWNGTGSGSFTGLDRTASLHLVGPINETLWILPSGTYNLTVRTPDLPTSATANFSIGGQSYSEAGDGALVVRNLTTGVYPITSIGANASSGWQYFGRVASGNPVPVPDLPSVNLTFAYVDVAASEGSASFEAQGLPDGTTWSLEFNGTGYSSPTPWINLTTRPGRFPLIAFPSVGPGGTTAFAPSVVSQSVDVSPGVPVSIPYAPSYLLTVLAGRGGSVSPSASSAWVPQGQMVTLLASNSSGYAWDGWSGSGTGAYSGTNRTASFPMDGPVFEAAAFYPQAPDRFNATLVAGDLPEGDVWTVYLGGVGHSSNSSEIVIPNLYSCQFSGNEGRYPIEVSDAYGNATSDLIRYVPLSAPPTACGGVATMVGFQMQFYMSIGSTVGGAAYATANASLFESGDGWYDAGRTLSLEAYPNPSYVFLGWTGEGPGSYTGTANPASAVPTGPIEEAAQFVLQPTAGPPPKYTVHLGLGTTLDPGTVWTVSEGADNYSSSTNELNVTLPGGDVTLVVAHATSPDGLARYSPISPSLFLDVSANTSDTVSFLPSYWLALSAVGPGTITPGSEWAEGGSVVSISAVPQAGAQFVEWEGIGPGSYSGANFSLRFSVAGPVSEVATFEAPTAAPASSGIPPLDLGVACALLLAAGVGAGLLLASRHRRDRSEPAAPASEEPTPSTDEETPGPAEPVESEELP